MPLVLSEEDGVVQRRVFKEAGLRLEVLELAGPAKSEEGQQLFQN